jgi:hypothetical protein
MKFIEPFCLVLVSATGELKTRLVPQHVLLCLSGQTFSWSVLVLKSSLEAFEYLGMSPFSVDFQSSCLWHVLSF